MTMNKLSRPYHVDLQFRGHVEGLTYLDIDSEPQCHYFGGVPYGLPALGPFRFQKPRSLPTCYRYGTRRNPARFTGGCGICPQLSPGVQAAGSAWDEDCLQSNIWIPVGTPPPEGWPVLFWLHGGFLQWGSPNDLDLRRFMAESPCKCIVVAPAYRLNIFGFLASSAILSDRSVNLGFWDQRLALQWTYENISYFGGNASNLTVGGYSAGSHSVFHQLSYDLGVPERKAIIKRVMMLSNGPGMQPKSLEEAQGQYEELLGALNISTALTPTAQLRQLRKTDAETLLQASRKMKLHQFRAVTDGSFVRHGLLNELSNGTFARRLKQRGIHMIIGECSDERFVYGTWLPPEPGYDNMLHRLEADYPREACKVLMSHYLPNRKLPPNCMSWQELFGHIYADVQIHALERGMLDALVKHGAGDLIHRYRIEWRAVCVDKRYPKAWGATHTSDMPIWLYSDDLTAEEISICHKAFQQPLSAFLQGKNMDWGTQHAMQVRTLKSEGKVAIEEDKRLEQGLVLWNALKKAGATGLAREAKL